MNSVMEIVCSACNKVKSTTKHGAVFQDVLKEVRKEFRKTDVDIKVRSQSKKFLTDEEFYVNAYYDCEDDADGETPIEVIIYHNFNKQLVWDEKQIHSLLIQIFDAVVHEIKHQRQSRKRKHHNYWNHVDAGYHYHEYLQDPDEIDAYALSIAIELCRTLGRHRALRYMPRFTTLARLKVQDQLVSPNLNAYVSHFEKPISPLLRKLAKKIYVRLKKIDTDYIFQ
jgi:hypothetical protein